MSDSSRTWPGAAALPLRVFPESSLGASRVTTPLGDLRVLTLRGSDIQRAADYGHRLRETIQRGVPKIWADTPRELLGRSAYASLTSTALGVMRRVVRPQLTEHLPAPELDKLAALADASQLSLDTLLDAHLMPELTAWLIARAHTLSRIPGAPSFHAPLPLSSSGVVARTPDHGILHGRNLDAPGAGSFDRFATVTLHCPSDGLHYAAVSSAGILGAGHAAMNSAGLTLSTHQHTPDELDLSATPLGHAGATIMRTARSIEDAVSVLREFPPVSSWTYVLTEGDTGRAAFVEVAPGHMRAPLIPKHVQAFGITQPQAPDAHEASRHHAHAPSARAHRARARRLLECVLEDPPSTPADLARHLTDTVDPDTGALRLFGPTIAALNTVSSVVFEPRARRLWVAVGSAPVSQGWFVPIALGPLSPGLDTSRVPFVADPAWAGSPRARALDALTQAARRQGRGEGPDKIMVDLEHALALVDDEPNLHVLAGLVALKRGRGRRAEGALTRALGLEHDPERRAEIRLYTAWALEALAGLVQAQEATAHGGHD
ncbi:MAG: C45 family autoproteolytic acyltransferase/hydrolase, partial [Myxococcota bacterium]